MVSEDAGVIESKTFELLERKLSNLHTDDDIYHAVENVVKTIRADATKEQIREIVNHAKQFEPFEKYLHDEGIEDIMINNTKNAFVYHSSSGNMGIPERLKTREEMLAFVRKLRMYATSVQSNRQIFDVHLPNGSRANLVDSPLGSDITIRNFKQKAYSMIDLINFGELSYEMAGRFWLYAEGAKVRPANLVIGGMPGSGKTTLLNAMFSFFRPEARVVVIEETYELNTETQDNCVRLETNPDLSMEALLRNSLRMRPDLIIIGEVRGAEAKDMLTAMNIGRVAMGTIHASTTRDIVTRLQHDPMNIPKDLIPLIDVLVVASQIHESGRYIRKITQVSEVSGTETQVLLSDLYNYDYKERGATPILPSVTFRDTLAKLSGHAPPEIMEEERRRAKILEKLNKLGVRDLRAINEFSRDYYDNPEAALKKIGLQDLGYMQ